MTAGIVIVGAGHCGVSAAHAAREVGFEGAITLIGDEPEWPYERPPLSKWEAVEPRLQPIFQTDFYATNRIELRRDTRVSAIDRVAQTVSLGTGETLNYASLLLATGAAPRRLPPEALPSTQPHYLRTYSDAQNLACKIGIGADVLIIGGGFIGLELAASLAARPAFVHVIEAQERILARAVPPEISHRVQDQHALHGVTIHTATAVTAITNNVAILSTGQSVRAEHVIVGIGSVPNTDLAADAGLTVDNGIIVNERFATQDPNVFAAGDCCAAPVGHAGLTRLESWQVAGDQGRRSGQIMAGAVPDAARPPWFWSDQFDHCLQVVGLPSTGTSQILRHLPDEGIISLEIRADGQIAYAAGFARGNSVGREIKVIQKIMEAEIAATPEALANPDIPLKTILRKR